VPDFPAIATALDPTPWSGSLVASDRLADTQRSFAAAMGRLGAAPSKPQTDEERARDTAEQLVTQTFILPLLKQLRESSQAAPPFAPNQAEKQFRALQDTELAQRIAHASRFPLVDRLARDLLSRGGKDAAGRDATRVEPPALPNPAGLNLGVMPLASHR
jgi:Rod binding domain-containing protein